MPCKILLTYVTCKVPVVLVNVLESQRLELCAVRVRIVITVGRRHYHLRTPDRVIYPAKVLLYYFAAVVQGALELWYGVLWQAQVLLRYKVLGNTVVLWYFVTE